MTRKIILTDSDIERFWSHVDKRGPDECWEWTAYHDRDGYAMYNWGGRPYGAHRIMLLIADGEYHDDMMACHHCDNPGCINPAHLYWGTSADNTRDMMLRGRAKHLTGEDCPSSKLTQDQVDEIRVAYATGRISLSTLAKQYPVTLSMLGRIVRNLDWYDEDYVPDPKSFRHVGVKGSRSILSWEQVREIRKAHKNKLATIDGLADRYGVSNGCIQKVIYYVSWRE